MDDPLFGSVGEMYAFTQICFKDTNQQVNAETLYLLNETGLSFFFKSKISYLDRRLVPDVQS